ncbi:amino acid-binding protein, partial [Ruminococcaceae bacterium OttesenSCG-928-I18]|nr:amino acid-binding protein [Ruminococcaceae bacterium OttesenSCG-928-I18]
MEGKRYLLVEASVVPQVFLRVLRAKELLASGEAKNVSRATQMADVSRSAFYKYKDSVFQAAYGSEVVTLNARLLDET